MKLRIYTRDALLNILTHKLRSILALLGIMIGTASVVAMLSGGYLANAEALKQFSKLGTHLLSTSVVDTDYTHPHSLTIEDADALNQIPGIEHAAAYVTSYQGIQYLGHTTNVAIVGADQGFLDVAKINIEQGRFISRLDGMQRVVVLGGQVAKRLQQWYYHGLLGQAILLNGEYFTVIGILQPWSPSQFVLTDVNQSVFVPIQVALNLNRYAGLNHLIFRMNSDQHIERVQAHISQKIHALSANKKLYFASPRQLIDTLQKQTAVMTAFLAFVASIALLVGGIGVMNIMLVSIIERRQEIGIRRALGAKRRDILWLFLFESLYLAVIGGVLGILLGLAASYLIAYFKHWTFQVFFQPMFIGFVVSAAVGIIFGVFPAMRAGRMAPIEALRVS